MLINIGDADPKTKARILSVSDETDELFNATVPDTAHGHKLAKIGLKHGWDSDELKAAAKAK